MLMKLNLLKQMELTMKKIVIAAAIVFATGSVIAQKKSDFYISANLGSTSTDSASFGSWGVALGYEVNKNLAVEAGYKSLESRSYSCSTGTCDTTVSSYQFSAKGIYPVNDEISVFGRLGMNMLSQTFENGYGYSYSVGESETAVLYGFGASYEINDQMSVNAEWIKNNTGTKYYKDTSTLGVGFNYKFK